MKILITGASGFLGCRLQRFLGLSHEVVPLSSKDLDVTDAESVRRTLFHHQPKVVIHLAAVATTLYCEEHPDDTMLINVEGTVNVAKAAAAVGAKLVFASTEQVYNAIVDGPPNAETYDLAPRTLYGRSKLQAELALLDLIPSAVCLRLTWMYDLPSSALPRNAGMLLNLVTAAREGRAIRASIRERRGITNVWEVVRRIEAAFALPGGSYNFGSTNDLNTFDIQLAAATELAERGYLQAAIAPEVDATPILTPSALVLPDESLCRNISIDLSRLETFGITFPSTMTGLHNAFNFGKTTAQPPTA